MTDKEFYFSMDLMKELYYSPFAVENTVNKLQLLSKIATDLGFKLNHLALAWAIKFVHLDSALIGARTASQFADNLKAIDMLELLSPEL